MTEEEEEEKKGEGSEMRRRRRRWRKVKEEGGINWAIYLRNYLCSCFPQSWLYPKPTTCVLVIRCTSIVHCV